MKNFVLRQVMSGSLPFDVAGCSEKRFGSTTDWARRTRQAVTRAHALVVMVGDFTHRAPGVVKEVQMAQAAGTPVVQIVGSKGANPEGVSGAGRMFAWTPQNIDNLFN